MILEVKQWPESQQVIEDPEWFAIMGIDDEGRHQVGPSAQARVLMGEQVTKEGSKRMGFWKKMDLIFQESDEPESDAALYIYERSKAQGSVVSMLTAYDEAASQYETWLDIQNEINKENGEDCKV